MDAKTLFLIIFTGIVTLLTGLITYYVKTICNKVDRLFSKVSEIRETFTRKEDFNELDKKVDKHSEEIAMLKAHPALRLLALLLLCSMLTGCLTFKAGITDNGMAHAGVDVGGVFIGAAVETEKALDKAKGIWHDWRNGDDSGE